MAHWGLGAHFTDLIMSHQLALPEGKTLPSFSLRLLPHLSTASGSLLDPGMTVWVGTSALPCTWEVSDSQAYPHGDGWVAPVSQGQGQQMTMVVMTKLTSSQAGSYDHSRMVDLVI